MIPNGTRVTTTNEPFSLVLCNRSGIVVERYVPPGTLKDHNEYLVRFDASSLFPEEDYYIACKFLVRSP